jgi:hypothetical protein
VTTFLSRWRCPSDGEECTVSLTPIITTPEGEQRELPTVDMHVESVPCPICGGEMRRVDQLPGEEGPIHA